MPLETIDAWQTPASVLSVYRQRIDARIDAYLNNVSSSELRDVIAMALAGGGKRFRGILLLACADAIHANPKIADDAALSIEMVQAHSLILDDLPCMDNAQERRDRPALHCAFNEAKALLAASVLLSESYAILTSQHDALATKRSQALASACGWKGIAQGQYEDLFGKTCVNTEKTAPLIIGAVQLGLLSGATMPSRDLMESFTKFGLHLGNAYQFRDDELDGDLAIDSSFLHLQLKNETQNAFTAIASTCQSEQVFQQLINYAVSRQK